MIERTNLPKFKYPDTQTPTLVGDDAESYTRDYYSYSDPDYEYMIYRTAGDTKHKKLMADIRDDMFSEYHREEPTEQNNYNFVDGEDYRAFLDTEGVAITSLETVDAVTSPQYLIVGPLFSVIKNVLDFVFHVDSPYFDPQIFHGVKNYLYFSEYVIPVLCLYFPFIDFFSLPPIYGWNPFVEQNFFLFFVILYLPFVLYFFLYAWFNNSNNRVFFFLSFFRVFLVLFVVFFGCLIAPLSTSSFFAFLPIVFVLFHFSTIFPFSSFFETLQSEKFYSTYSPLPLFLPAPFKRNQLCLPLYRYSYPWVGGTVSNYKQNSFHFPPSFIRVKSILKHFNRINSVKSYTFVFHKGYDNNPQNSFINLKPHMSDGFILDQFPSSFGYSAVDHYFLYFYPKIGAIDVDPETGERQNDYVFDFITNELGVSNIRFFELERYHLPAFKHYEAIFSSSLDSFNFFGPRAFNLRNQHLFGPYYSLALWLKVIRPADMPSLILSSFSSASILPNYYNYNKGLTAFKKFFSSLRTAPSSVFPFVVMCLNFFYTFVVSSFFRKFFSLFFYRFSRHSDFREIMFDFTYVFSFYFFRVRVFKEFFKFVSFLCSKKAALTPSEKDFLKSNFVKLHFRLCFLYSYFGKSSFFRIFKISSQYCLYTKICIMQIERFLKNLFI